MESEQPPFAALPTLPRSRPPGADSELSCFVLPCSAVLSLLGLATGTRWVVAGLRSWLEQLSLGKVPRPGVVVKAWSRLETMYLQPSVVVPCPCLPAMYSQNTPRI